MYGDSKKVVTNRKIIPSKQIGTLLAAEDVLKKAEQDVETYKLHVAQECEHLKEQAQQEGFAAGYQQWAQHIALLEKEIASVHEDMKKLLIPVALKAAKKIVGREIELSEDAIVDIVASTLKSVSQHKKITIYVNKRDLAVLERNRARIKEIFEALEALSIRERGDVIRGGCIVETEGGIINAQLENQWSALERAFSSMIKQPKVGPVK